MKVTFTKKSKNSFNFFQLYSIYNIITTSLLHLSLKPYCKNLLIGALMVLVEKTLKDFMPCHLLKSPKLPYYFILTGYFGMLKFVCSTPYSGDKLFNPKLSIAIFLLSDIRKF